MMGDVRARETALSSVDLALSGKLVVATLRIPTAAGGFGRLVDMGADARVVAQVSLASFGLRLLVGVHAKIMVFEKLTVSDSIRDCIASSAAGDVIMRQAVAEGMKTLRQRALKLVAQRGLTLDAALSSTPV